MEVVFQCRKDVTQREKIHFSWFLSVVLWKSTYDLFFFLGGGGATLDISVVLKFLKCVLNLSYLRNLLDFLIYSPYNISCNKICAKYIKMLQQECDLFFFSIKTDCDFIKVDNKKLLLLVNFWSVYRKKRFISNRRLSKLEKWHSVKWFSQISWANKFPASKYSFVGNYSTQKAPLQVDRIQSILV